MAIVVEGGEGISTLAAPGLPCRLRWFDSVSYLIGGQRFSSNDIEHGVLRGNQPRHGCRQSYLVHGCSVSPVAVACMGQPLSRADNKQTPAYPCSTTKNCCSRLLLAALNSNLISLLLLQPRSTVLPGGQAPVGRPHLQSRRPACNSCRQPARPAHTLCPQLRRGLVPRYTGVHTCQLRCWAGGCGPSLLLR